MFRNFVSQLKSRWSLEIGLGGSIDTTKTGKTLQIQALSVHRAGCLVFTGTPLMDLKRCVGFRPEEGGRWQVERRV